jgi:hypothetical protein
MSPGAQAQVPVFGQAAELPAGLRHPSGVWGDVGAVEVGEGVQPGGADAGVVKSAGVVFDG